MKTNILILITLSLAIYGITYALMNNNQAPERSINNVPDKSAIQKELKGNEIPDFTFTDINGKTHKASDFKGKVIVLNFWATWCAPCIKEFPNLITTAQHFSEDVVLIALSSDLEQIPVDTFLNKIQKAQDLNINSPNIIIALDENQAITAKLFQTFKLPETLIIDKDLNLRHKLIGADWTLEDINALIEAL